LKIPKGQSEAVNHKIPKGQSEAVNRRKTDNTMTKRKRTNNDQQNKTQKNID